MRTILLLLTLFAGQVSAGIFSFTATPLTFLPGQEVTLSWSVTAGDSISINQGVPPISGAAGSVNVIPTGATTYVLTDTTSKTTAQVSVTPFSPPQLTHRWSFNEGSGTAVNDSVGTSHGILRGTTWSRTASQVSLPGGVSASAPYIDLPNDIMAGLTKVTFEVLDDAEWRADLVALFRFRDKHLGRNSGTGRELPGTEYMLISAQVGATTTSRRLSMKDNNVENMFDVTGDTVTYGQQFHFACVYDPTGNGGTPRMSYYKNGVLLGALNTAFRPQDIVFVNNWLGRSNFAGDANTNGAYNEFRIWNGPLSPGVIADNVAAGPDALPTAPRIEAFNAFPSSTVYRGSSVRLSYVLSDPANGALTASIDNGIGALTQNSGFIALTPAVAGTTTYTLTVSNGTATRTAPLTVVVLPSEPTAETLAVTAKYNVATPILLVASDPNTPVNQLVFSVVSAPAHGTLTGTGANLTYTPVAGYSGPDVFSYKANDGTGDSNVATVTINVLPAPAPPVSIALSQSAFLTSYTTGAFAGRLQAVDPNPDDQFTFQLVGGAGATHNGFFSIAGNQLIAQHDFAADLGQTISIRIRVTDSTGNSIEMVLTRPVQAPDLHVKINEVNYNPARNTQLSEYIELYNPFPTEVNVGGWRFSKGVDYTFPAGTVIAPNGYLVIAGDPATMQALYGVTALGPFVGGLSSEGDDLVLKNAAGTEVDKLSYGITSPWPVPPNGDGPSLELINPDLDNDLGGHWRASTVAPTVANYVTAGSGGWRYRKGTSEASSPVSAWRTETFVEDATWLTGTMPIGLFLRNSGAVSSTLPEAGVTLGTILSGLSPDTAPAMATYLSSNANSGANYSVAYRSVFFRKTFTVSGAIPRAVLLRVMHNDAAIVWINGMEVGAIRIPAELRSASRAVQLHGNITNAEMIRGAKSCS